MHSERQHNSNRRTEAQPATADAASHAWADLQLAVPNDRSDASIVAFVECVLVELTHEDVGAEYRSENVAGVKRTQFIADDDIGETFRKRHFDERLGSHETTVSREAVRDELINRLTRSSSLSTDGSHERAIDDPDRFRVKHAGELRIDKKY